MSEKDSPEQLKMNIPSPTNKYLYYWLKTVSILVIVNKKIVWNKVKLKKKKKVIHRGLFL